MLTIGPDSMKFATQTPLAPEVEYDRPDSTSTYAMDTSHPWKSDDPQIPIDEKALGNVLPSGKQVRGTAARVLPTFLTGALSTLAMQPLFQSMMGKRISPPSLPKLLTYALMGGGVASGVDVMREKLRDVVGGFSTPEHEGTDVPGLKQSWMNDAFDKEAFRWGLKEMKPGGLTGAAIDAGAGAAKLVGKGVKKVVKGGVNVLRNAASTPPTGQIKENSWMTAAFSKEAAPPRTLSTTTLTGQPAKFTPMKGQPGSRGGPIPGANVNTAGTPASAASGQVSVSPQIGAGSVPAGPSQPPMGPAKTMPSATRPNRLMAGDAKLTSDVNKAKGQAIYDRAGAGQGGTGILDMITGAGRGIGRAGKWLGSAGLGGAGIGAGIGSIIPGLGTLAGGAIGGGIGKLLGGLKSKSDVMGGTAPEKGELKPMDKKDTGGFDMKQMLPLMLMGGGGGGMSFGGGSNPVMNMLNLHVMNQMMGQIGGADKLTSNLFPAEQKATIDASGEGKDITMDAKEAPAEDPAEAAGLPRRTPKPLKSKEEVILPKGQQPVNRPSPESFVQNMDPSAIKQPPVPAGVAFNAGQSPGQSDPVKPDPEVEDLLQSIRAKNKVGK